ncbi:MAG TPA: hypothetical protein V6D23_09120 [Candidatus Obscuribacterales bacterium]
MSVVEELPANRLTRYRHEESENYLARGVECMLLAEEGGYSDRALLKEACDSFIEAIKFNRQHTEAYVGMAYLLWILGDSRQALSYLEQGLRTQPSHPDVHALIQKINGRPANAPAVGAAPVNEAATAAVTALVKELLAQLESEKTSIIAASVNTHAIELLQEKLQEWEVLYDRVLTAIDGLDAFHQRVMLTVELGPVQDRIMAYHEALRGSERLLGLDDKILENLATTRQYIDALNKGDTAMFLAYLEILLDNCDALADELESLEKAGLNVRTLESHYQQLTELVEEFQAQLDAGEGEG